MGLSENNYYEVWGIIVSSFSISCSLILIENFFKESFQQLVRGLMLLLIWLSFIAVYYL